MQQSNLDYFNTLMCYGKPQYVGSTYHIKFRTTIQRAREIFRLFKKVSYKAELKFHVTAKKTHVLFGGHYDNPQVLVDLIRIMEQTKTKKKEIA